MRRVCGICAVLALSVVVLPPSFAEEAGAKVKAAKSARGFAKKATAKTGTPKKSGTAQPVAEPAGRSEQDSAARAGKGEWRPAPDLKPMPATSGTLGLFTVETGETLPAQGFSVSAYVNKFSRMPGSVTVLNVGFTFGVGIRDWLTLYTQFEPYRHIHVGRSGQPVPIQQCPTGPPPQLSLNTCPGNPPFPNAITPTMYRSLSTVPGSRPGYVEDYPFAFQNESGIGELTVGFKLGILSEHRGDPISFSARNDFIFPTRTFLNDLLENGSQSGQFNYAFTLALSKAWSNFAWTGNWGYRFTRDPRANGQRLMEQADQIRLGTGFILFLQSRVQFMNEYTGVIFVGTATPNRTFGARDPADGVWGLRLYPVKKVALDVGYRYMLNLGNHEDRHGFVFKLSGVYWPEKVRPNNSPTASCSAEKTSVYADSGESVAVRVQASDPDGDPLTYTWTASGGSVEGTGPEVRWNSAGTASGSYTVTARVDDGRGGTASCAVDIKVEPRLNRPPTISLSADRTSILTGERARITAQANDPDNDPLTYSWRTNAGQIVGSGESVELDTTGGTPGQYTVTGRVDDGRGGAADASITIDVQAPPPPPQASKINECSFGARSARVDNVCKRILDDVALRLKNEPRATVVIVGFADPREPRPERLAQQRADNAAKYLGERGVEASRINTRAGSGQAGAGEQNYRIDIVWVPEGATY